MLCVILCSLVVFAQKGRDCINECGRYADRAYIDCVNAGISPGLCWESSNAAYNSCRDYICTR